MKNGKISNKLSFIYIDAAILEKGIDFEKNEQKVWKIAKELNIRFYSEKQDEALVEKLKHISTKFDVMSPDSFIMRLHREKTFIVTSGSRLLKFAGKGIDLGTTSVEAIITRIRKQNEKRDKANIKNN